MTSLGGLKPRSMFNRRTINKKGIFLGLCKLFLSVGGKRAALLEKRGYAFCSTQTKE